MFEHILAAKKRLQGHVNVTPVMTSRTLNRQVGAEIHFKCENFQRIGAFKFRGAFNSISKLSEAEKDRGVITYSSGYHAQAVALVCRILNVQSTIVMPNNAPVTKRVATEDYGATIVDYDPEIWGKTSGLLQQSSDPWQQFVGAIGGIINFFIGGWF